MYVSDLHVVLFDIALRLAWDTRGHIDQGSDMEVSSCPPSWGLIQWSA